MQATARAQPNIALIKYWGKRDTSRNLPAAGSISATLADLYTQMTVSFGADADSLTVNGARDDALLPRISACLDRVAGERRSPASVVSTCNFPVGAGLASSASAFAATVVAASAALGQSRSVAELASLAGQASGSAARSLYGGIAELRNAGDDIAVDTLLPAADWPLRVVIAITRSGPKPVSSGEAMEASRRSSPFYDRWISDQPHDLDVARAAITARDFRALGRIAEHNCLKMHSVMWASRPPIVYWNEATLSCLYRIRELQSSGIDVFFTVDAGPQVKAFCVDGDEAQVSEALSQTPGVEQVLHSGLGPGAALVEPR